MEMYQPGAIVVCGGADSLSGDKLGCFNLSLQARRVEQGVLASGVRSEGLAAFSAVVYVIGKGAYAIQTGLAGEQQQIVFSSAG